MELAYISLYWRASGASGANMVRLNSQELEVLGDGWEECRFGSNYYYTNGQDALWDISNLVPGGARDAYAVEIQVVCRVTDPDVLIGGQTKDFNNTVELQNQDGETIGSDSNGVTISKTSLSKAGTYDSSVNGGTYPFKITLNELGEDLVEGGDSITLIDELGSSLVLDTTSISVINSKTNEVVDDWKASISTGEKTVLKLKLPDDQPLTITYETSVNAAPGAAVSISNVAHWEGYTAPSTADVEVKSFTYSAGGTAESNESPSLKILKKDQNNTSKFLSGATFTLQAVTYENGVYTPVEGSTVWTGTTSEDGSVTFGKSDDQVMKYNTIYCLKEIKSPKGYMLDTTPHYFAIGKSVNGTYQTFPEEVDAYYLGAEYTCEIYDHPVTYELPQTGGTGTDWYQKAGALLAVTAMIFMAVLHILKKSVK
jgi:LPXTG-motif cell wall-anchored protein